MAKTVARSFSLFICFIASFSYWKFRSLNVCTEIFFPSSTLIHVFLQGIFVVWSEKCCTLTRSIVRYGAVGEGAGCRLHLESIQCSGRVQCSQGFHPFVVGMLVPDLYGKDKALSCSLAWRSNSLYTPIKG